MSSALAEAPSQPSVPEVVDLEALLAPIPGENPAGENLQYAGLHDEIREARRADEDLDQGDWKRELKVADWLRVISLASDALSSRTKDLQIGAWLSEALVKRHGFAGLRAGLAAMRGLHEHFWDNVYPEIDEGDLEARANSLYWMDRQVAAAMREVPLTRSGSGADCNYMQWTEGQQFDIPENYEQLGGTEAERAIQLKTRAVDEKKTTSEDWRKAKNGTRRAFYEETFALLNQCWEEFNAMERAIDEKFGRQAPALSDLKKTLDEVRALVEKVVKEKRILEPDPVSAVEATTQEGEVAGETVEGAVGIATGAILSRGDALRRLAQVAEYFRKTEPHSPVSYLVQRAISWGEMPLESWLQDVIKDGGVLASLRETLGIKGGADGGGSGGGEEW